ncbi:hypothetical protein [Endozoicomonas sp. SESOKO1]|uniref:hypothetical protein n=1 Tax=Endozoicomonas sp. SESOKO1 TaxID=2828742 RepID=UPI002147DEB5|nr:hypothetical protein [Endozoicomonas sp. SESOKO1]
MSNNDRVLFLNHPDSRYNRTLKAESTDSPQKKHVTPSCSTPAHFLLKLWFQKRLWVYNQPHMESSRNNIRASTDPPAVNPSVETHQFHLQSPRTTK